MAVPNSALLAAAAAGMQVTVAHPPGYELNAGVLETARRWCRAAGTELTITHDQRDACRRADVVYAKSWGAAGMYGDAAAQGESFRRGANWMVGVDDLGPRSHLMHCLPVRRNVVISDAALDDPRCVVVDQAENRLWAQAAVLSRLFSS
jgi:N-acetylornithine carbamoyltransferase